MTSSQRDEELEAHSTIDGWCCACEADQALILLDRSQREIEARIDTANKIHEMRYLLPIDTTSSRFIIDANKVKSYRVALTAQLEAIKDKS